MDDEKRKSKERKYVIRANIRTIAVIGAKNSNVRFNLNQTTSQSVSDMNRNHSQIYLKHMNKKRNRKKEERNDKNEGFHL